MHNWRRWLVLVGFAVAMAWMEAATVVYIRTYLGRLEPYQATPLPMNTHLGAVEVIREAATILMLITAGWLAGTTRRSRFAYFMIAFGIWDIFYYVFLAAIGPWPRSVWDWDILFLIPLPWWGPVLAPASIAGLMVAGGSLVALNETDEHTVWPSRASWTTSYLGAALALFVFMADAIAAVARGGRSSLHELLPTSFNWVLFLVALAAMAMPLVDVWSQLHRAGAKTRATQPSEAGQPATEGVGG